MATTFSREDVLAQRLRSCYQLERNIVAAHLQRRTGYRVPACWDIPRKRANSMQRASVWHKLARFCDKQKFNPFQLIRWAVSVHRLGFDRPPEPNQLLNPSLMESFELDLPKMEEWIGIEFKMEMERFSEEFHSAKIGPEDSKANKRRAFGWALNHVQPLTAHCLAARRRGKFCREIAEKTQNAAMYQFLWYPEAYQSHWARIIPPGFASIAQLYYLGLLLDQS